jgi:soluble lytic murein transglycosylase-like protein
MARRTAVRNLIIAEARRAGVPVRFALAVAWQESGWRQSVVSNAGAVGVMQLLPSTADWIGEAMLHATVNVWNRRQNVRAGVTLLKHYLLRYKGNRRFALAAYYQGQRSADRHGVLPVSHPYVASVLLLEELLEP